MPTVSPKTHMDRALDTLTNLGNDFFTQLPLLVIGIVAFGIFVLLARLAATLMKTVARRAHLDTSLTNILSSLITAFITLLGLLVAAVIVFPAFSLGNLFAGIGLTSLIIAFGLKDVMQNFMAGIMILWRKPFQVGDQIQTQGYEGTVEEINIRSVYIRTFSDERVVIPTGSIYIKPVVVSTAYPKRRVKMTVGIGYFNAIETARSLIREILTAMPEVSREPEPWIYVSEFAPSEIKLSIYFWTGPEEASTLRVLDMAATRIKRAFDEAGIAIPYPHQVVLFHDATGSRPEDIQRENYLQHRPS